MEKQQIRLYINYNTCKITNSFVTEHMSGHSLTFKTRGSFSDTSIGSDVFFEIIYPPELEYTYKLRPAKDFGAPFVSIFKTNTNIIN